MELESNTNLWSQQKETDYLTEQFALFLAYTLKLEILWKLPWIVE